MGSQETTAFPVTASAKLTQEIFNARQSMCNPSERSVTVHQRKRKKMYDAVEYIANLSSGNLSDLHALLHGKVDKCLEGRREMLHNLDNLQEKSNRAHKKRKKSRGEKGDMIPRINRDEKNGREEAKAEVRDDANVCRHTFCPTSYALETTQACEERIPDAANNFDSMISFEEVADGSFMRLLELENAADEECYKRAVDFPLSPSLPEIKFDETFIVDNSMYPFSEEELHEDLLSSRTDLVPSPYFDVINVEINSNEQTFDVYGVSSNSQNKTTQARKIEVVKFPDMHTPENSRILVEEGVGSLHNQLPKFCIVSSNIEDSNIMSRILVATKNCMARCNLATQTGWAVSGILTALKMEEKLLQKEKVSVLFTLLLFNFMVTATMTFGKLKDGNLSRCSNSYSEHIHTALSDAETKILFLENYSLHELLGLIEEFLIEGKVIANNMVPAETLSDCDLGTNDFVDCVNKVSSDTASSEQLVAGSIILASSWHWTDVKLVPQLLNMLDSYVEEKIAVAIIVLLGQLGRIGVDVGGYEERGVENLRCYLFAYLCRVSSRKASISLQIATANTLFGLLPVGLETLFHTNTSLSAYSKSVSDNAETLRSWFSELGRDQQILLSGILRHADAYNK